MVTAQGETKVLKLKNLRPQDYASYSCQVSVRNVCGIPDKAVSFRLTNTISSSSFSPATLASLQFSEPRKAFSIECVFTFLSSWDAPP